MVVLAAMDNLLMVLAVVVLVDTLVLAVLEMQGLE
jgi:hypothetical protein